jgi:hypothetical protein
MSRQDVTRFPQNPEHGETRVPPLYEGSSDSAFTPAFTEGDTGPAYPKDKGKAPTSVPERAPSDIDMPDVENSQDITLHQVMQELARMRVAINLTKVTTMDDIARDMFKGAPKKKTQYEYSGLDPTLRRDLIKHRIPQSLTFSGRSVHFDGWALSLIEHYNMLEGMFMEPGESLPERYKIETAQYLLPAELAQEWLFVLQSNRDPKTRQLHSFQEYLTYFRPKFGRERSMTELWDEWHNARQLRSAEDFIKYMKTLAISLKPTPSPFQIGSRIRSGLKDRVKQKLLEVGAQSLPSIETNLLDWERRVVELDRLSFRQSRPQESRVNAVTTSGNQFTDQSDDDSSDEPEGGNGSLNAAQGKGGRSKNSDKKKNSKKPKDKSKIQCFGCGEYGHYKNECPKALKDGQATKSGNEQSQ